MIDFVNLIKAYDSMSILLDYVSNSKIISKIIKICMKRKIKKIIMSVESSLEDMKFDWDLFYNLEMFVNCTRKWFERTKTTWYINYTNITVDNVRGIYISEIRLVYDNSTIAVSFSKLLGVKIDVEYKDTKYSTSDDECLDENKNILHKVTISALKKSIFNYVVDMFSEIVGDTGYSLKTGNDKEELVNMKI